MDVHFSYRLSTYYLYTLMSSACYYTVQCMGGRKDQTNWHIVSTSRQSPEDKARLGLAFMAHTETQVYGKDALTLTN
jgi:hypothetical protein